MKIHCFYYFFSCLDNKVDESIKKVCYIVIYKRLKEIKGMLLMKRIGIDVDGTLTTMDAIVSVFNRETGKNLSVADLVMYDVGKCFGLSKEDAVSIWKNHSVEIFQRSICIWDIEDFMNTWRNYNTTKKGGNEILIVTAREQMYEDVTKEWLKQNKIEYDSVHFGYGSKLDAVNEHFLDVMVDDKAGHIKEIDEDKFTKCEAFIVDQPYNRWYESDRRIFVQRMQDVLGTEKVKG